MAKNSKIEWTHHTANMWWGCSQVHIGCDNCYALSLSKRYGKDVWGTDRPRRLIKNVWDELEKYQKQAEALGEIHRVFVGSMMDIFEKPMPLVDHNGIPYLEDESEFWNTGQLRDKFFNDVVPKSPNLMFLLLTKRPSNINKYIPKSWKLNPPKNVMFGTSPVNQETANKLIVQLSEVNGKRFISVEPQLEEIDLLAKVKGKDLVLLDCVDWVINGGESGHGKRPFDCDWGRLNRDNCESKGVPFFFKQIDKVKEIPDDLMIREFPNQIQIMKTNKKSQPHMAKGANKKNETTKKDSIIDSQKPIGSTVVNNHLEIVKKEYDLKIELIKNIPKDLFGKNRYLGFNWEHQNEDNETGTVIPVFVDKIETGFMKAKSKSNCIKYLKDDFKKIVIGYIKKRIEQRRDTIGFFEVYLDFFCEYDDFLSEAEFLKITQEVDNSYTLFEE